MSESRTALAQSRASVPQSRTAVAQNRTAVAQTRTSRLHRISEILLQQQVGSQARLAQILAREGIEVTQATLSRDLEELQAEKVRGAGGGLVYRLPAHSSLTRAGAHDLDGEQLQPGLARLAESLVLSATTACNLVVVRTPVGAAKYFASVLDRSVVPGLLGTVAGDDTVLLVAADAEGGEALASRVLELAEGRRDDRERIRPVPETGASDLSDPSHASAPSPGPFELQESP